MISVTTRLTWLLLPALATTAVAATDAQCNELLDRALHARNPDTRKQAVVALSLATERDQMQSRLVEMLSDKDVEVRLAVVGSLAEIKDSSAQVALRQA